MDSHTLIQALIYPGGCAHRTDRGTSGAGVRAGLSDRRLYYWSVGLTHGH